MTLEVVTPGGQLLGWMAIPAVLEPCLRPGLVVAYAVPERVVEVEWAPVFPVPRVRRVELEVGLWANDGAQPRLVLRAEVPLSWLMRISLFRVNHFPIISGVDWGSGESWTEGLG